MSTRHHVHISHSCFTTDVCSLSFFYFFCHSEERECASGDINRLLKWARDDTPLQPTHVLRVGHSACRDAKIHVSNNLYFCTESMHVCAHLFVLCKGRLQDYGCMLSNHVCSGIQDTKPASWENLHAPQRLLGHGLSVLRLSLLVQAL